MASRYEDMAESLQDEIMTEAAEGFFGSRREVERYKEFVEMKAERLRRRLDLLAVDASLLRKVLLDDPTATRFFSSAGVDPEAFAWLASRADADRMEGVGCRPAFALGTTGKYVKTVRRLYDRLRERVDEYIHGRYVDEPDTGKKLLTPNLKQLDELIAKTNELVERVNRDHQPGGALRFAREFNVQEREKRDVAGADLVGMDQRANEEMAVEPLSFQDLELPRLPALPAWSEAEERLEPLLREVVKERKEEVRDALCRLREVFEDDSDA